MRPTVPPSAEIEGLIDWLPAVRVGENPHAAPECACISSRRLAFPDVGLTAPVGVLRNTAGWEKPQRGRGVLRTLLMSVGRGARRRWPRVLECAFGTSRSLTAGRALTAPKRLT